MNIISTDGLGALILGAVAFLGLLIFLFLIAKFFYRICSPNEVLVLSGGFKRSRGEGGQRLRFATVTGGRAFYIPGITAVTRLSLNIMEVPIQVRNSYSKGGIAMNIDAIANIKISSDPEVIGNAVERFLNRDTSEIRRVGKETLEGHLRGVIATLTPEQVNEDRLLFAESLTKETEEDLRKLGLHLDTLKILHVSDEVGYLDATGRKSIALVVKSAEIAESDANRDAEQAESEQNGRADTSTNEADGVILQLKNEYRRLVAELDSKVKQEEERTVAAAREARARAEQRLQQVRSELETLRLQVDQVLPAEAERIAAEYKARGNAALIRERGNAVSSALATLAEAWKTAGPTATQISLIEDIEKIIATAAEGINKVRVNNINIVDSDGSGLTNYIDAYPKMLESIFNAVSATTGIDVQASISGRKSITQGEQK